MSDTASDLDFWGRRVLRKSQTNALRERMEAYAADTPPADIEELRQRTSGDTDLSELVRDDRDERI